MLVKFENGVKDVDILEVTNENYIVPENEKHLYHCKIEVRKFDANTGKRLNRPRIQKFGKKMYENNISHNLQKQGYTVDVLYNPNDYLKEQAAKKELTAAKKKQIAEEKMQKQIEQAVEVAIEKKSKTRSKKESNE